MHINVGMAADGKPSATATWRASYASTTQGAAGQPLTYTTLMARDQRDPEAMTAPTSSAYVPNTMQPLQPMTSQEDGMQRSTRNDRGYVQLKVGTDHPLGNAQGWAYEHRVVLYDHHDGRCPPECYWCGEPFDSWADVNADHINYERSDNRTENIRATCRSCNIGRHRGSDLNSWAVSMATRRILRRYRDEFNAEVDAIASELHGVESGAVDARVRRANQRYAALAISAT
jgi:hypothetical protein